MHPLSYATKNCDNEVYCLHEAMQQEDREDFIIAMQKEIEDHCSKGHWKPVLRNTIGNIKIVRSVWSFKRKRRPDGSLLKHKARLCVHEGCKPMERTIGTHMLKWSTGLVLEC